MENATACERVVETGSAQGQHIVICGAGPSLREHAAEWCPQGDQVWGCNSAATYLQNNGHRITHGFTIDQTSHMLAEWLDPSASPEVLKALAISAPSGTLARTPVSRFVNDPRHDDERCVAPEVAPQVQPEQVDLFAQLGGSPQGGAGRPPTDEEF